MLTSIGLLMAIWLPHGYVVGPETASWTMAPSPQAQPTCFSCSETYGGGCGEKRGFGAWGCSSSGGSAGCCGGDVLCGQLAWWTMGFSNCRQPCGWKHQRDSTCDTCESLPWPPPGRGFPVQGAVTAPAGSQPMVMDGTVGTIPAP